MNFFAIDNREKSRNSPSSSDYPVVSDNRRSDNRDLTVVERKERIKENSHIQL